MRRQWWLFGILSPQPSLDIIIFLGLYWSCRFHFLASVQRLVRVSRVYDRNWGTPSRSGQAGWPRLQKVHVHQESRVHLGQLQSKRLLPLNINEEISLRNLSWQQKFFDNRARTFVSFCVLWNLFLLLFASGKVAVAYTIVFCNKLSISFLLGSNFKHCWEFVENLNTHQERGISLDRRVTVMRTTSSRIHIHSDDDEKHCQRWGRKPFQSLP